MSEEERVLRELSEQDEERFSGEERGACNE